MKLFWYKNTNSTLHGNLILLIKHMFSSHVYKVRLATAEALLGKFINITQISKIILDYGNN